DSIRRPLDPGYTARVLSLEHERLRTLGEAAHAASFFFTDDLSYDTAMLIQKGMDKASTHAALLHTYNLLARLDSWEHTLIEVPMRELAMELGLKPGQLFGSIRVAISGRTATPPLFQMMEVLGRERTMARIEQAI